MRATPYPERLEAACASIDEAMYQLDGEEGRSCVPIELLPGILRLLRNLVEYELVEVSEPPELRLA